MYKPAGERVMHLQKISITISLRNPRKLIFVEIFAFVKGLFHIGIQSLSTVGKMNFIDPKP